MQGVKPAGMLGQRTVAIRLGPSSHLGACMKYVQATGLAYWRVNLARVDEYWQGRGTAQLSRVADCHTRTIEHRVRRTVS